MNKCRLPDGLDMATYYRQGQGTPLLCIPGLTRNHRDFLPLLALFPERPFYLVDLRGRGQSDWDDQPARYQPPTYAADLVHWLDGLPVEQFDWVGTSLGGILTMALGATHGHRMRRVVINDIGPVIERAGIDAIRARVGRGGPFASYQEAKRAVYEAQSPDHPLEQDWDERTRALCIQEGDQWRFDYDPRIAQQAQGGDIEPFWDLFESLAPVACLVLRGERSDLFSAQTLDQMRQRHPNCLSAVVPDTGHAPTLKESAAQQALLSFLG